MCQKPPSPTTADRALAALPRQRRSAGAAEPVSHRRLADIEGLQRREGVTADIGADMMRPNSCWTSFIAEKIGRSGQPVQKDGGRPCTLVPSVSSAAGRLLLVCAGSSGASRSGRYAVQNFWMPAFSTPPVYSPAIGSIDLPSIRVCTSARRRMVLTFCSMKSGWPSSISRIDFLPAQNLRTPRPPADR